MIRKSTVLLATLLLTASAFAQNAHPSFDVATIKPSAPLDMGKIAADVRDGKMPKLGVSIENGRAEYTYVPIKELIATAYNVHPYQIMGPDWMQTERFDIVAKLPEGASKDDAPAMLQALLEDRFKLKAHKATQEQPVLALTTSKGGPKMKEAAAPPAPIDENTPLKAGERRITIPGGGEARVMVNADGSSVINMGSRGVVTQKMDMQTRTFKIDSASISTAGLTDMLNNLMQAGGGRQVVDMTGLKGYYQVSIELSLADLLALVRSRGVDIPNAPAPETDPGGGSSVYESVAALGLKLDSRKAPIEQLIVDSVEKAPTAN